jgi:serine/threonine protein phosphatase PrpC
MRQRSPGGNITVTERCHQCWLWGGASHPGGRSEQQDRWGVFTLPDQQGLLAVVADGMGGHRDGAVGAQAAVDATARFIRQQADILRKQPAEALSLLCKQSHATLAAASRLAHSTIVTLWLYGDQAHWMHVGDSRLYHLRQGRRLLRTRDHSTVQLLLELGEISEAELATHPDQNRLYRSLGSDESPKPELGSGRVELDDLFALCSDGLWEHISETELWETVVHSKALSPAAAALVERAAARGGPWADNATLILIRPARRRFSGWHWLRRVIKG